MRAARPRLILIAVILLGAAFIPAPEPALAQSPSPRACETARQRGQPLANCPRPAPPPQTRQRPPPAQQQQRRPQRRQQQQQQQQQQRQRPPPPPPPAYQPRSRHVSVYNTCANPVYVRLVWHGERGLEQPSAQVDTSVWTIAAGATNRLSANGSLIRAFSNEFYILLGNANGPVAPRTPRDVIYAGSTIQMELLTLPVDSIGDYLLRVTC